MAASPCFREGFGWSPLMDFFERSLELMTWVWSCPDGTSRPAFLPPPDAWTISWLHRLAMSIKPDKYHLCWFSKNRSCFLAVLAGRASTFRVFVELSRKRCHSCWVMFLVPPLIVDSVLANVRVQGSKCKSRTFFQDASVKFLLVKFPVVIANSYCLELHHLVCLLQCFLPPRLVNSAREVKSWIVQVTSVKRSTSLASAFLSAFHLSVVYILKQF